MNYRYLRVPEAESSAQSCSVGKPSDTSNGTTTASKSSHSALMTESTTSPQSLLTCVSSYSPVLLDNIEDLSTFLRQGSRANHSRSQESNLPQTTKEICGRPLVKLSRLYDPTLSTLKTRRGSSVQGTLLPSSETLSVLGTKSNRRYILALMTLERYTTGSAFGFTLPTPRRSKYYIPTCGASEGRGSGKKRYLGSVAYRGAKTSEALRTSETDPTYLNPLFAEGMMGWPTGLTALEPLAMDRFRSQWLRPMQSYLQTLINKKHKTIKQKG